jgi:hypothetical protein
VPSEFFSSIKTAATSPYALIAYVCLLAAWVYIATKGFGLRHISKIIMAVPEKDRAALLAKEYNTTPRKGLSAEQWIRSRKHLLLFLAFIALVVALAVVIVTAILTSTRGTPPSGPAVIAPTPAQDLTGIQKTLEEINQNLARTGRHTISVAQMDAIKELDRLIVSRDETTLRQAFGFPKMMETNIRMNIAIVRHFQGQRRETLDLRPFLGTDWMMDSELAEGHIRRFGGGFQYDPPDGKRVYLLALPNEYTVGKKVLFKFENSSELPTSALKTIKDLDDTVYKNADKLLHVLNDAIRKDPDYYLRYDDQTSPQYFHQIDAMWLDNFIQLRPKADNIRDAVRQFLGVGSPSRAVQPITEPLEIVAFRSDYGVSIANNGPHSVHVMSLLVKGYVETKSFALRLDIAPGKVSEQRIQEEGLHHVRSLMKLADTWEEHIKKARELYSGCGMQWTFFSPSDVSLQQIKDLYTKQNLALGYSDISGILYYRVAASNKTEEQVVPIVETITVNDDTCPKSRKPPLGPSN